MVNKVMNDEFTSSTLINPSEWISSRHRKRMTGKMLHKVITDGGRMDWTQLYSYEFLWSHLKVKWTTLLLSLLLLLVLLCDPHTCELIRRNTFQILLQEPQALKEDDREESWHNSCHEHKTRRSIRTINYAKKGILLLLLWAECIFHCSSNWLMPFKLFTLCDGIHWGFISITSKHIGRRRIELSLPWRGRPLTFYSNDRLMGDTWGEALMRVRCVWGTGHQLFSIKTERQWIYLNW